MAKRKLSLLQLNSEHFHDKRVIDREESLQQWAVYSDYRFSECSIPMLLPVQHVCYKDVYRLAFPSKIKYISLILGFLFITKNRESHYFGVVREIKQFGGPTLDRRFVVQITRGRLADSQGRRDVLLACSRFQKMPVLS
jgi:hypothetical protein